MSHSSRRFAALALAFGLSSALHGCSGDPPAANSSSSTKGGMDKMEPTGSGKMDGGKMQGATDKMDPVAPGKMDDGKMGGGKMESGKMDDGKMGPK